MSSDFLGSPAAYRKRLMVELADGTVGRYVDHLASYQVVCHEAVDPMLRRIVDPANAPKPQYQRAWFERHRAGSKTTDGVVMASYPLTAATRPIYGVFVARDRDQAGIARRAFEMLARCNPILGNLWRVDKWQVKHTVTGSQYDILAADEASSYGLLADIIVCDEVSLWGGDGMWTSMLSTAGKRPHAAMICLMNAGWTDTWTFKTREAVRQDPRWFFHSTGEEVAPWITSEQLDEQRRLLPPEAFARLWRNQWVSGSGNALSEADLQACLTMDLPPQWYDPRAYRIGGLDLALKRDKAGFCLLEVVAGSGRVKLVLASEWSKDEATGQIDLMQVESDLLALNPRWPMNAVCFDPWGAGLLAQRLQQSGFRMIEVPFSGPNVDKMTRALLEATRDHALDLYNDEILSRDLRKLSVTETQWGYRLTAPRDSHGHADTAFAMVCALQLAWDIAREPPEPDYSGPDQYQYVRP